MEILVGKTDINKGATGHLVRPVQDLSRTKFLVAIGLQYQ